MIQRIFLLLFLLLVACRQGEFEKVVVYDIKPKLSPIAHLDLEGFWKYQTADIFMDGGSVVMGFINENGEVLYIWFDYSMAANTDYRRCRLQRTYNDKQAIEIMPKSELEQNALALIENAHCHDKLEKMLPERARAIEIIKTRNIDLNLLGPARVIPMK